MVGVRGPTDIMHVAGTYGPLDTKSQGHGICDEETNFCQPCLRTSQVPVPRYNKFLE